MRESSLPSVFSSPWSRSSSSTSSSVRATFFCKLSVARGARKRAAKARTLTAAITSNAGADTGVAPAAATARVAEAMQRGDYAEAFCHWRPLAEQGHTDAEYHLGWFYANGHGLRVDMLKAVYWWTRAAEQGHADSQYALAVAYGSGEGLEQDPEKAVQWLLAAAHQGNDDAQAILREKLAAGAPEVQPLIPRLADEPWVGQAASVGVETANVRAGPGTDTEIVAELQRGDRVLEIYRKADWVYILLHEPKRSAWIYAPLLDAPEVADPTTP